MTKLAPAGTVFTKTTTFLPSDSVAAVALERISSPEHADLNDYLAFERALAGQPDAGHAPLGGYFEPGTPIFVVRAPARLDCMGGIADYCGATVCEYPLDRAVIMAMQARPDRKLEIHSIGLEAEGLNPDLTISLDDLEIGSGTDYRWVRDRLKMNQESSWAAYVAGAFSVLSGEGVLPDIQHGVTIVFTSTIPSGSGISSSAAVEVATITAANLVYNRNLDGMQVARLAQMAENHIVGAPCGIMDQVTSALGRSSHLLCLDCQPHEIKEHLPIPDGLHLIGFNTNVKHSVGGPQYTDVRIGAFMGLGIIGSYLSNRESNSLEVPPFGGYLCNVSPMEYHTAYRSILPQSIQGSTFLNDHGALPDTVTTVDPHRSYMVRSRVSHPIYEHARVQTFIDHLASAHRTGLEDFLIMAGRLMYASDWSYAHRCGLGSPETGWVVRQIRKLGAEAGFYGAKITGGGSGGTVAIAGNSRMFEHLEQLVERYTLYSGHTPELFTGSSPGACQFGHAVYRIE
ncbi:MAG: GHMP kinase [Candidatus Latescibacteria bacterium]|nr:GHMP kinase [Candidatus Latescibacterota bacterium]